MPTLAHAYDAATTLHGPGALGIQEGAGSKVGASEGGQIACHRAAIRAPIKLCNPGRSNNPYMCRFHARVDAPLNPGRGRGLAVVGAALGLTKASFAFGVHHG